MQWEELKPALASVDGLAAAVDTEVAVLVRMGFFDDFKKSNKETYQAIIHQLCRLELIDPRPVLHLTEAERHFAGEYFQSLALDLQCPVIGLNTGAGGRWAKKSWKVEQQVELVHLAKEKHPEWQILLLGGPEEVERNQLLEKRCPNLVINTGQHLVRKFAALVGQTHVLVTADTLTLHIGLALRRQIIALFGPTSHAEIDLCAEGEKLFAELDCLGC